MKKTGETLKKEREAQGLTISEISLVTKISPRVLQSIEEGNLEHLPAKSFLRGFILTYSQHLKLNSDEVLAVFLEELKALEPQPVEEETVQTEVDRESAPNVKQNFDPAQKMRLPHFWRWAGFGGLVILIVVTLTVKRIVDKYQKEKKIEPIEIGASQVATGDLDESKKIEKSATAVKDTQKIALQNNEISIAAKQPEDTVPVTSEPPTTPAPPSQRPTDPPDTQNAQETSSNTLTEEAPRPNPVKTSQEIILEALDRIEVNMQMGARNIKLILQPDEVYSFKSSETVTLEFSDGGAVNIIVNGRDRGVPGDLGVPKKISLP